MSLPENRYAAGIQQKFCRPGRECCALPQALPRFPSDDAHSRRLRERRDMSLFFQSAGPCRKRRRARWQRPARNIRAGLPRRRRQENWKRCAFPAHVKIRRRSASRFRTRYKPSPLRRAGHLPRNRAPRHPACCKKLPDILPLPQLFGRKDYLRIRPGTPPRCTKRQIWKRPSGSAPDFYNSPDALLLHLI